MNNDTEARHTHRTPSAAHPATPSGEHPLRRLPERLAARSQQQRVAHRLVWLRLSQSMFVGPDSNRAPTVCGSPPPLRRRARCLRPDL